MSSRPKLDYRAKTHLSYFAYACHRFSGLLLACLAHGRDYVRAGFRLPSCSPLFADFYFYILLID